MPVVQMPDGQLVDMPDNPTPEQLAALKKVAAQAPQESAWDTVKHKAKLFASDVVKGVAGLPALILDAAAIDPETGLPPKESFGATKALQGSMTTPKTEADKWQSVITQGAAGGALSGNPAQGAFVGGVSGATSEGSARLFGEGLLPRLLGGLAGGLGAGAAVNRVGRISANAEALAKEALEGIDPTLLAKAKTFMEASGRQGVSMDIAQALEAVGAPASNITTIRNVLANNKAGDRVQMILRGQPTELQLRATTAIGGMPGTVWGEQQAANNLAETATKRLTDLKDLRSATWQDTLRRGIKAIEAAKLPAVRQAAAGVRDARGNLAALSQARQDLEAQMPQLQAALKAAQSNDAVAVAAANAKLAQVQQRIAQLETFTLPRGRVAGNTGRMLDLPSRGQSIDFDQIAREVEANRLRRDLGPAVEGAPSLETLQAQKGVRGLQGQVEAAAAAEHGGQRGLQMAEQGLGAAKADFRTAREVPPQLVAREVARLRRLAADIPNTPKAAMLNNLADDMAGLTRADQLNEVLKATNAKTKTINLNTPGIDAGAAKYVQSQVEAVRQNLETAFQPYRAANQAYKTFTEEQYNPVKQGPVGQLAGKGYQGDIQAPVARMNAIFAAGVDPQAKVSTIKQAAGELAKVDKTAFADAAKTYYSGKVAQVFEPTIGGAMATNGQAADRLWQALFANEKQYQGMKDTVTSIAKTYGLSEQAAARGLENFAQITKALRSRPATAGGLARDEVFRMGGKNYGADALRIFGFLPFERAARRLEDRTMQNAFRDFDNLLTTPEGVDKLIQLSKVPAISDKALTILSTLGGTAPGVGAAVNTPGVTTE